MVKIMVYQEILLPRNGLDQGLGNFELERFVAN
jgi:hypothetical protein